MQHTPAIYSGFLYGNTFPAEFPTEPHLILLRGGFKFRLGQPFQFTFCLDAETYEPIYPSTKENRNYVLCTVTVPAHFVTNLISSPPILWPIVPQTGPGSWSSIVHDYMYTYDVLKPNGESFTKKEIDQIFHIGTLAEGMNRVKAYVSYRMLRAVGVHAWRDAKKEAEAESSKQ